MTQLPKKSPRKSSRFSICDSLMRYADMLGYGGLHIKIDKATGLKAIVAIHNLKLGPAIGGCRMLPYATTDKAIEDVLRLGYMMTYKAAINNLPHGGAKSVIIKPAVIKDRDAFFGKFGEFVAELGGQYITAVDSGTNPEDMDIIAKKTRFVTCTTGSAGDNDPSPLTSFGVTRGIEAAVHFKLKRNSLEGITVSIQGAGHVGYHLAKDIHKRGGKLIMTDIKQSALDRCKDEFNVEVVAPEDIYKVKADVFAPCALGAIINRNTINQLNTTIVAGSANNQLAHSHYGSLLHQRGILYAPDFLINAGGLIHVAVAYAKGDMAKSLKQISDIYDTAHEIYARSIKENKPTNQIAEKMARERMGMTS